MSYDEFPTADLDFGDGYEPTDQWQCWECGTRHYEPQTRTLGECPACGGDCQQVFTRI
jgi:rubrerythrin